MCIFRSSLFKKNDYPRRSSTPACYGQNLSPNITPSPSPTPYGQVKAYLKSGRKHGSKTPKHIMNHK